jgi:hypothetical protein
VNATLPEKIIRINQTLIEIFSAAFDFLFSTETRLEKIYRTFIEKIPQPIHPSTKFPARPRSEICQCRRAPGRCSYSDGGRVRSGVSPIPKTALPFISAYPRPFEKRLPAQ